MILRASTWFLYVHVRVLTYTFIFSHIFMICYQPLCSDGMQFISWYLKHRVEFLFFIATVFQASTSHSTFSNIELTHNQFLKLPLL